MITMAIASIRRAKSSSPLSVGVKVESPLDAIASRRLCAIALPSEYRRNPSSLDALPGLAGARARRPGRPVSDRGSGGRGRRGNLRVLRDPRALRRRRRLEATRGGDGGATGLTSSVRARDLRSKRDLTLPPCRRPRFQAWLARSAVRRYPVVQDARRVARDAPPRSRAPATRRGRDGHFPGGRGSRRAPRGRHRPPRDATPGNVLLEADGTAALADFGLARGPRDTVVSTPGGPSPGYARRPRARAHPGQPGACKER